MVLFRRKPVVYDPLPQNLDPNTEVWEIKQTGEVFPEYDRYLEKRDFYLQKSFTCQATGRQRLTFFDAQESETDASNDDFRNFPEGLKEPVLRFVQHQDHQRMDDLVNDVYDHFKEQFIVGDRVSVEGDHLRRFGEIKAITDNRQLHAMFSGQAMDDMIRSYTYVIEMGDSGENITKYKASELQRDKKIYSKKVIKKFLRATLERDDWIGAPWTVKNSLAKRYSIPTKIPDSKEREVMNAQKKFNSMPNGATPPAQPPQPQHAPNGHGPFVNGHKPPPPPGQGQAAFVNNFVASGPPPWVPQNGQLPPYMVNAPPRPHLVNAPPPFPNHGPSPNGGIQLPPHLMHLYQQPHHGAHPMQPMPHHGHVQLAHPMGVFQTSFTHQPGPRPSNPPQPQQAPPPARVVEYVKYPCEDLEIKQPRLIVNRPTLKFLSDDVPTGITAPADDKKTGILMKSVGSLLCVWETLNVHDTIYMLDSFTFDDFIGAMRFSHDSVQCELFVEMHCAVLKQIVNASGKLQLTLPKMTTTDDSSEEDSSKESSPTPEPEPPVRTTRGSLRRSGAAQLVGRPRTPTPEPPKEIHKAAEFVNDFDWIEQCKTRNFVEGGWQAIIVALLYRLSFDATKKEACDEILAQLVPPEEEPTTATIAANYNNLNINFRISALEIIIQLTVTTEAFRDQLVAAAQEMTKLRKEKIEFQRKRKELADDLFRLDLDRKISLPENTPASPTDNKDNEDVDMSMTSVNDDSKEARDAGANEAEDATAAKSRTRTSNKNKRKAAAEEARKEKAKKVKAEAEKTKKQKEWEKLLAAIDTKKEELKDCEANINELDDDLRETMVHRSKVLGKDRFLNKYYWFEHNGMPFGGVPNSSTAEYGYANGRIWVQGPDEYELQPNLEEPALSQDLQRFGYTIPQRKQREEGSTHLSTSSEWGYYDDPEDIDKLLVWLDERGHRERVLRKELQAFRERIVEYMRKMRQHLDSTTQDDDDEEDNNTTRISTRNKTYVENEGLKDRCLFWTNSIMREEQGYIHSDEYEPPKKGKAKSVKAVKAKGRR